MKPHLTETYSMAVQMARLGFRKKIISHELEQLPERLIATIIADNKDKSEVYDGRIEGSSVLLSKKENLSEATKFMLIYLEIAEDPDNRTNISEILAAYKIYREVNGKALQSLKASSCWLLARDYRAGTIQLIKCQSCKFLCIVTVKDKVWHRCPFCNFKFKK